MGRPLPHAAGAPFTARFDGHCPQCGEAIYEGDRMQYIDDVAVCGECGDSAVERNHETVRENRRRWEEAERAKDPEKWDAQRARVKAWTDRVLATAADHPGKDWVPSPSGQGFVNVTHPLYETQATPTEQEDPLSVEPGIQALMAAGMLQGQEPGGDGVCNATITAADGSVTEVAIPVPVVDPQPEPPAKAPPRKRASRAKPKPEPEAPAAAEVVPSIDSVGDAAAAALARVRSNTTQADVALAPNPNVAAAIPGVDPNVMASIEVTAVAARTAQLEAAAKDWDPAKVAVQVSQEAVAAQPDALQVGLQAAVDSGAMTAEQATALGWMPPAVQTEIRAAQAQDAEVAVELAAAYPSPWVDPEPAPAPVSPIVAAGPRTTEALDDFKANYANPAADIFIDALAAATSMPEEDAILGALDALAPYGGPVTHEAAKASILEVLEGAITNHPRSLQKTIGPSEIGTECDHCLAAKLAGWSQVREAAWLPTVGTAVHSWIESAFGRIQLDAQGRPRYLMERKVAVGEIGGVEVTGSTDLVDLVAGMTWDWKVVGKTTLQSAKGGPSLRYKVQQMLYARGWRRLGVLITHVGIAYLPRNEMSLRSAVFWTAEYDEQIALDALARANQMDANLKAMESISVEARDKFITSLPRWRSWRALDPATGVERLMFGNAQEGTIECHDCARYPDLPKDPQAQAKQLEGLL